jgi:type IV secretory pathway VirB10-like protein
MNPGSRKFPLSALFVGFSLLLSTPCPAQDVSSSGPSSKVAVAARNPSSSETISLTVPKGTAVQVVLDKELRIQKVGQPVRGRVAEPIYAFDKLVVPVGTQVTGQILQLERVSDGRRTLEALNADFSPARKVQIEFNDLEMPDGRHLPIHTTVTPGSGQVIQFVTSSGSEKKKTVKDAASEKADQAKAEAKRQWDDAMKQIRDAGKMHKIERYAVAQLPVHPQYIDAGTVYFAELVQPLDFGSEPLTPEIASALSEPPPSGSSVHVRLLTALSSGTSRQGDEVEAVISQPLFDGDRLVLPQGSLLKGSVVQVRAARRLSRNGQLRMIFHQLLLPDGLEQKVDATLAGVQAGKGDEVKLDAEGGAEANSPKTRYLATGISVMLALASAHTDADAKAGDVGGGAGSRAAGGAGGFKLVGLAMGVFVHSQPLGMAMGAYGASMSVYSHFLARGRDLVFPKNTAMEVSIGLRPPAPLPSTPNPPASKSENPGEKFER